MTKKEYFDYLDSTYLKICLINMPVKDGCFEAKGDINWLKSKGFPQRTQ